jgi:putative ABC transport system permease protein
MSSFIQDVRFAARSFARTPGVTALAVLTLALGIGANAAIFSVIHGVLISPLPYPAADRVAIGFRQNPRLGDVSVSPSRADIERWRTAASVEAITMYMEDQSVLTGAEEPESLDIVRAEPDLLAFVGLRPLLGRGFTPEDAASEAAAQVVLLTEGLWRRRFGADPGIVGRTIELSDKHHEVVGVVPASFRLPLGDVDALAPLPPLAAPVKGVRPPRTSVSALVRVKPGVSFAAAQDELTRLGAESVGGTGEWRAYLMRPSALSGPSFRRMLFVLFGAVGCVLLIACANVAHLVLARNAARQREIAVRVALGASSGRLIRQLLTENLLLAVAGGVAGIALGLWGVDAISALRPVQMRQLADIRISPLVFGFAFVLALVTGLVFGLLPAVSATRRSSAEALKQGSLSMAGHRGAFVRRALSVAEIALALILLAGAGLLLRSYARLLDADLGFRPGGLLTVNLNLPQARYSTPASQGDFMERFAELLRSNPGVRRVVLASGVPPASGLIFGQVEIEGRPPAEKGPSMFGGGFVQPGFFEVLGIEMRQGRAFSPEDLRVGNAAIVNERMAQLYWPGESAVGKRMRLGPKDQWNTIIGVAANLKVQHGEAGGIQIYFPLVNAGAAPDTTVIVSTAGDPRSMIPIVKSQAWSMDPKLPLEGIATVDEAVAEVNARPRFNLVLLSAFAAVGLLLATIGTYGVVSYSVGLRTREIGVRMALGALPSDIRRGILKEVLLLAAAGTGIGILGAFLASQLLANMLFEVSPNDPLTLGVVALVLTLTALAAGWIPSRRAMRVDPMVALRAE